MRTTFGLVVLSFASAVAGCDGSEPQADAAPAPVEPWEESAVRPRASDELIGLDLSGPAVAELSADELWVLGVEHLGWTAARPAGSTKEQVHQLLLQGKYREVGDFGR
jgi:hypothetical protein